MILKLFKNGEYRSKDDKQSPQYKYYYYDYVPEENAIVIHLETAPDNCFDRVHTKADKIKSMYKYLKRKLISLGFVKAALQFDKDKSLMIIKRTAFHEMLVKRVGENRPHNEKFNDAMATVELLEMLNLKIHTDFLPQFQEIIRDEHKFFGLKSEMDNNIKTYTFFIKNDCPVRLRNHLLRLLINKIIHLTNGLPGLEENVKFIDDQVGSKVVISDRVYNQLHDEHVKFLQSYVVEKRDFNADEHYIKNVFQAKGILKELIFDKPLIKYEEKAQYLKLIVGIVKDIKNLKDVIQLYEIIKENHDKVDIHRHWFADKIFGKKYTTSWQNAMKEIREHALALLDKKLKEHHEDTDAKKKILEEHHKSAIFTDHRSNNPFRFFYKPNILKRLDMTLEKYTETLRATVRKV